MNMYKVGSNDALDTFGLRTANDRTMRQRMPEGPMHIGAERLARMLSQDEDQIGQRVSPREKKLERPTRWGPPASLESGNGVTPPPVGLGHNSSV